MFPMSCQINFVLTLTTLSVPSLKEAQSFKNLELKQFTVE